VGEAVLSAAAGNPLAVLELPEALSERQRRGEEPLEDPLSTTGALQDAFGAQIRRLSKETRSALAVAAAAREDEPASIAAACAALGLPPDALEAAEGARLVRLDQAGCHFRHPLVRSAAYSAVPAAERRDAHLALAGVLPDTAAAWHLGAAATGPDERAAAALERAAAEAVERRGYAAATTALERAAVLSPDAEARARRLTRAGRTAIGAGRPDRALAAFEAAADAAAPGPERTEARHLAGWLMAWTGNVVVGAERLSGDAEAARDSEPLRAAAMFADAAVASSSAGDCRATLRYAQAADGLLGDDADDATRAHVGVALAWGLILRGERRRARETMERVLPLLGAVDPFSPAAQSIALALNVRLALEDYEEVRATSLAIASAMRTAGALGSLPLPLLLAADAGVRLGRWADSEREVDEALPLAEESGEGGPLAKGLVVATRLTASQGREEACREYAARMMAHAEPRGIGSSIGLVHASLGLLELSYGRIENAIADLEVAAERAVRTGLEDPAFIPWAPDLVEAYALGGRAADAQARTEILAAQAERTGGPWAAAAAARCRGLLTEGDFESHFEEALAHHERSSAPFDKARTLLLYGGRLHRARRRAQARERMHEARSIFTELGAKGWLPRTEAELRAVGGRRRRKGEPETATLTAAELRVAEAVARGGTNKEVAAELYLSPKTVEFHLAKIFQKLGVRSRTELASALPGAAVHDRVQGVESVPP